jgi:hypothetical protein
MVKNLKRIALIILLLIGMGYNYCYADLITLSPMEEFLGDGGTIIIGTVVLIVMLISFYILKVTAKNSNSLNIEENKKDNKEKAYNITMIIAIIVHYFSLLLAFNEIRILIWLIPSILFIMSKAIRTSSKKTSNIFWTISMCIILSMFIYNIFTILLVLR